MTTIKIPNDLVLETNSIMTHDFETKEYVPKQKMSLNKNTFSFLKEGTKVVYYLNNNEKISNDKFILLKKGDCLMTHRLSEKGGVFFSRLLFFTDEDVLKFVRKYGFSLDDNKDYNPTKVFKTDSFILTFVESLSEVHNLSEDMRPRIIQNKFEELMLYLVEVYGLEFLNSFNISHSVKMQRFLAAVENNKYKKLTIQELAFLANMSESTFKRLFKKHFKCSPGTYFKNMRLDFASSTLRNGSLRPSDIWDEVGYESHSSFSQAFKKKFGKSPYHFAC
jgi:AraC-like DNA-binding protein